ncbi:AsmA family protein, partial [Rhodoferax sp. UBA5149]|uniref:AsmA family protein n=1 Tax=Rhodoferax sp. UBA5149 TaxID=1947379 RepID=UPI0025F135E0
MKRILKWMFVAGLALLLLLAAGAWALQGWLGTEDFKARAEREASALLGVAVKLERIDVDLWPLPALALGGVQIQTRPPLTLERLELRPTWRGLMQGRLELASVLVRRAMLAQ